jgi:hypothetical protein
MRLRGFRSFGAGDVIANSMVAGAPARGRLIQSRHMAEWRRIFDTLQPA